MTSHLDLDELHLDGGSHSSPEDGMCVMEAVAYFAHEPHSDKPKCVSPAIGAFLRSWNDSMSAEDRQRLKPYIPKVVGTSTTAEDESTRAWMATDWLARTFTPAWLDLAGLGEHASALRALGELTSAELADAAIPVINAAWDAARAAARDAARAAAWAALQPTVVELQGSAFDLLDRMIAVGQEVHA